jgi:hypothetical protein
MEKSMQILIPVSVGELVDKLTILNLKLVKVSDKEKLKQISHERDELFEVYSKLQPPYDTLSLTTQLANINTELWRVEDLLREYEHDGIFSSPHDTENFIQLARSVYRLNDQRFTVKNQISQLFGSDIQEVKSYVRY